MGWISFFLAQPQTDLDPSLFWPQLTWQSPTMSCRRQQTATSSVREAGYGSISETDRSRVSGAANALDRLSSPLRNESCLQRGIIGVLLKAG